MNPTLTDNVLIIAYFLLWVLTLFLYQKKNCKLDAGSAIIITYICYAFFSILTLNRPIYFLDYYEFNHLAVFPFIYLFVMLVIALSPAIAYHAHPANHIEEPNTRIFHIIALLSILSALVLLPHVITNFGDGLLKLLTDIDAGKDAYEEQLENASDSGGSISNLVAIVYNSLSEISIFTFFYFMTFERKNVWLAASLGVSIFVSVLQPIMSGQRGPVIYVLLTVFLCYMFFKQFLSQTIKKVVRIIGIAGVTMTLVPIVAITVSRQTVMRQSTVTDYVNWYIGQGNIYFNNYALDDNGIRYGDRTFNLVKRVISSEASQNYSERRSKYGNLLVNDDVFTTFVGDFTIDFGPVVAFLIFLVFNVWVLYSTRIRCGKLKIQQALLLYFTMCICMQGGMTLFSFSDTANLKMVCFALLYVYLEMRERIMAKFSKQMDIVVPSGMQLPKIKFIINRNRTWTE